ncbi:MAG: hypothetical protein DRH57_07100, partial [Candidatus Cloacimonadota bacterium]
MKKRLFWLIALFIIFFVSKIIAEQYRMGLIVTEEMPDWIKQSPEIKLSEPYKESCDNSEHLPPVGSQGTQSSCLGWAVGYYYKTYQEWQEHQWDTNLSEHQFSPAFIYNHINGGIDKGCTVGDAFKVLSDMGCATISDMPYYPNNYTNLPDEDTYFDAIKYRTEDDVYYKDITTTAGLNYAKNHLANGNILITGILVYDNFYKISDYDDIYCVIDTYGDELGGHAFNLVGYDDNKVTNDGTGAFRAVNSWGTDWGNNGYFWISYQAMQSNKTSIGYAFYCDDKIGYSPTIVMKFHVQHNDRYSVKYLFGIGSHDNPDWTKEFFIYHWLNPDNQSVTEEPNTMVAYPSTNIVVDLSDGKEYLYESQKNTVFIRCKDNRQNSVSGTITYLKAEHLVWPQCIISDDPPVAIPDDGSYAYSDVTIGSSELAIIKGISIPFG